MKESTSQVEEVETAESPHVVFRIEDSIVYAVYKKGVTIDLEAAREIGHLRRSFLKGRSYPGFADVRHLKLITKEARAYLEKEAIIEKEQSGVTAIAVLVGSRISVFMANLFMKIVKPKIPTKLFITKEQGLKWLEQFKSK